MKRDLARIATLVVSLFSISIWLGACQSNSGTGNTTREQCLERFWDDQDGDGWGTCISEESLIGNMNINPTQTTICDGTDSCYDSGEDHSEDNSYDSDQFVTYWNGRENVECPEDIWGEEPCG